MNQKLVVLSSGFCLTVLVWSWAMGSVPQNSYDGNLWWISAGVLELDVLQAGLLQLRWSIEDKQVAQLSQRDHTAGWVSFRWVVGDGMGQTILCTKRFRCQETKSIDLLHDKSTFIRKTVTLHFWAPLWGLGATYFVHLRIIGKPVVDFTLVIIELFFDRCYGSSATSEYRLEVAVFEGGGQLLPKMLGRRGRH